MADFFLLRSGKPRELRATLIRLLTLGIAFWCRTAQPKEIGPAIDIQRDFIVRHWTTKDGVPNKQVRCLAQDADGYLWLGTPEGLARFDGLTFTVLDRGNEPALNPFQSVYSMLPDHHGGIWLGLERTSARLTKTGISPAIKSIESPFHLAGQLLLKPDGRLHIRTADPEKEWIQVGPDSRVFELHDLVDAGLRVAESDSVELWFRSEGLLTVSNLLTSKVIVLPLPTWTLPHKRNGFLKAIPEPHGGWWILHGHNDSNAATTLYQLDMGRLRTVLVGLPGINGEQFLSRDHLGRIWIPMSSPCGLICVDGENVTPYKIPTAEPFDVPRCLLEGTDGALWLGTDRSGLFRLEVKTISAITVEDGLPHSDVRSLAPGGPGLLWVGTERGLAQVRIFSNAAPTVESVYLTNQSIRALLADQGDTLWVGTGRGLWKLARDTIEPMSRPLLETLFDRDAIGSIKVRVLSRQGSGEIWMTSARDIFVWDATGSRVFPFFASGENDSPMCMLLDSSESLWLGTDRSGVTLISSNAIMQFHKSPPPQVSMRLGPGSFGWAAHWFAATNVHWLCTTNGLASDHVYELYEDSRRIVWVATDKGLARINASSDRTSVSVGFTYNQTHGLPDHQLTALIEDTFGQLWCGSARGIFRVSLEELDSVASGKINRVKALQINDADGLPSTDVSGRWNHPTACRLPDGRIAFATAKGVGLVDPRLLGEGLMTESGYTPPVVIDEASADGEIIYGDSVAILKARARGVALAENLVNPRKGRRSTLNNFRATIDVNDREPTVLGPGRGRIVEFHFDSPQFTAPELTCFQYRLDGLDRPDVWHDVQTRRFGIYNNLSPGAYRFLVHARDSHLRESTIPAAFSFVITAQYWQTWWFWLGISVFGLSVIAVAIVIRERVVRRVEELKRQAALAQLRARVAGDLHDGLGTSLAKLNRLADRAEQSFSSQPLVREHLSAVTSAANELTRVVREIIWNANPGDASLEGLISQIGQNTYEACESAQIVCRLDLPLDLPVLRLSADERSSIFFAAKEAVTNIVRHSRATALQLKCTVVGERMNIHFSDNGTGFESSKLAPPSLHGRQGIKSMQSRIESLGGCCTLTSRIGQGTEVQFDLPLNKLAR